MLGLFGLFRLSRLSRLKRRSETPPVSGNNSDVKDEAASEEKRKEMSNIN
jgi:hypothetical protein